MRSDRTAHTREYAPGRLVDVHDGGTAGVALLWHGRGRDHRSSLLPLARLVAACGVLTLVPDWDSEADDGGRADLLTSVRDARETAERHGHDPGSLVVGGWSLGGTAALSLAVHAKRLGIGLGGAVLIAPGDGARVTDPISGQPLPERFSAGGERCPIDLVYGTDDPLATPDLVSGLELRLRAADWRTAMHELVTDHAGIVGGRYDERTEGYPPSRAGHAIRAAAAVAGIIAGAATSSRSPRSSSPVVRTGPRRS